MLDVYICEDNTKQLESISRYVSDTILIEQLDMQLACASTTPEKILEQVKISENTGVFFLDIGAFRIEQFLCFIDFFWCEQIYYVYDSDAIVSI